MLANSVVKKIPHSRASCNVLYQVARVYTSLIKVRAELLVATRICLLIAAGSAGQRKAAMIGYFRTTIP